MSSANSSKAKLPLQKRLEHKLKELRPYLMLSWRQVYSSLLKRGMNERREGEPIICFDLAGQEINVVGGRYYCSFVRDVIDAGYFPVFVARRGALTTFAMSRFNERVMGERLGVVRSLSEINEPFVLITDRDRKPPPNAQRVVRMNFERRLCSGDEEMPFPVFVHPRLDARPMSDSPCDLERRRTVRLFFGGRTREGAYDKDVISDVYGMLSRIDMLAVASATIPAEKIHQPRGTAAWLTSSDFYPYVFVETQHCHIPQDRWLEALARADFFLACPGVDMPLCHNLIESMAAGCIPILQYASYLTPPLQDRVNCLTFHDAQSLSEVLDSIFTMSDREIMELRKNARAHYDEFLAPGCFVKRLVSGPQKASGLLLNSYRVPR